MTGNDDSASIGNFVNCTFRDNTSGMGAIYVRDALAVVEGCVFRDNHAQDEGAAIGYGTGSTLAVVDSCFERNGAFRGGAIAGDSSLADVTISGSVFYNNGSSGDIDRNPDMSCDIASVNLGDVTCDGSNTFCGSLYNPYSDEDGYELGYGLRYGLVDPPLMCVDDSYDSSSVACAPVDDSLTVWDDGYGDICG